MTFHAIFAADEQKPDVTADNVKDAVKWRLYLAGWSDKWEADSLRTIVDSFRPNKHLLYRRRSSSLVMPRSSKSPYGRQHHLYQLNANCQRQMETNEIRDQINWMYSERGTDQRQ